MRFQSLFYSIFIKCKVMIPEEKGFWKKLFVKDSIVEAFVSCL